MADRIFSLEAARKANIYCIGCTRCAGLPGPEGHRGHRVRARLVQVGTLADSLEASGCQFCTACVEVCPTGALADKGVRPGKSEEDLAPCKAACRAHIDIPGYLRMIARGRRDEAYAIIREKVPLSRRAVGGAISCARWPGGRRSASRTTWW